MAWPKSRRPRRPPGCTRTLPGCPSAFDDGVGGKKEKEEGEEEGKEGKEKEGTRKKEEDRASKKASGANLVFRRRAPLLARPGLERKRPPG